MKRVSNLSLLCITFLLCSCASPHTIHNLKPFEETVALQYIPSAGHVDVKLSMGDYAFALDSDTYSFDYSIKEKPDSLLWTLNIIAKLRPLPEKLSPRSSNKEAFWRPTEDLHGKLIAAIRTDKQGNVLAVESIKNATTGKRLSDKTWYEHYEKIFTTVFVPFSQSEATLGSIVSRTHMLMPLEMQNVFPPAEVKLVGKKHKKNKDYLVLEHKIDKHRYKNKSRLWVIGSFRYVALLDPETKMLFEAESACRMQGTIYLFMKATFTPARAK